MAEIGQNIATRRKELGMTQEELAQKMGYKSKSTINKIELGKNDIPQSKISMFAKVLETTPGQLMGWEEVQNKNDDITDIIVHLRTDKDFFETVKLLHVLDDEKLKNVQQTLTFLISCNE